MTADAKDPAYGTILLERADGIAWVTLNRPERLNATTEQMHHELLDAFDRVADDGSTRVLVLTGAGDRAFCIGSDLGFLTEVLDGEETDSDLFAAYLERLNRVVFALERMPVPTIAMVQAKARASGFEMVVACDFVLIAEEARIGDVHTPYGHMPGAGATHRTVRKMGLQPAMELLMTGRWLSAAEAVDTGLALRAVPRDRLREETASFARTLADVPGDCLRHLKSAVMGGLGRTVEEAVAVETSAYLTLLHSSSGPVDGFRTGQRERALRRAGGAAGGESGAAAIPAQGSGPPP
ncbi:enoyl-CoA hydratase/isomerase family protein [Streptomyces sp. NPDC057287]|uniref:enoyl-CoA hydratase/isomerase family protein n=1 Tax=Streptomyces sp. NPDC057287 TaxID=3346086 RepID=UPI00363E7453